MELPTGDHGSGGGKVVGADRRVGEEDKGRWRAEEEGMLKCGRGRGRGVLSSGDKQTVE